MKDKCNKYEALFTFADEKTLADHIKTCEDCAKEQETMDKISDLLKEVKPYYIQKRKSRAKLKAACAALFILLSGTTLGVINLDTDISDTIKYGMTLSADDLGLPVDEYGFIMVE
ncbi:hypothetical protein II810_02670 [bacterium]|nr:hypothetical protein [bacterium]